jgi:uncharacterized membrane protein/DNA-directed RNA polymerase subunit RPC12/RpoP
METLSVRCNHCGAPLTVSESTRFVTCQFCQSNLEVKRTDSSVFTEELAKIADKTERIEERLEVIELQQEIERVDRQWAQQEALYMVHGKRGPEGRPISALFGSAVAVIFACILFGKAFEFSTTFGAFGGGFGVVGLIPAGMGIYALVLAVMNIKKEIEVQQAQEKYRARRAELVAKLHRVRGEN